VGKCFEQIKARSLSIGSWLAVRYWEEAIDSYKITKESFDAVWKKKSFVQKNSNIRKNG